MATLWSPPRDPLLPELDRAIEALRLDGRYRDLDRNPEFPRREFEALGSARWLGLTVPRASGGRGLPPVRAAVLLFHLARRAGTTFAKLALQPEFASVLREHGSPSLVRAWYRPLVAGRRLVGNQITEPGAGSDAGALGLRADRRGRTYVLSGTKSEVAFAADAEAAIVYARTSPRPGSEGISAFLVPQDTPGVRRTIGPGDLGERWQRRGTVQYEGAVVPDTQRLGTEGEGLRYVRPELERERGLLAAIYLGVAHASWEETAAYVGGRRAFGKRLADLEGVALPLVEDATRLEAAWLLTERALSEIGDRPGLATAAAKAYACEVALRVLDHAIQFHGGRGYSRALPHEQRWRDVRSGSIAHGPSELLLSVVARGLWPPEPRPARAP